MVWTEVLRAMTNKVRCAIYTRKSTEEGLEQEFNSLDAQREACEAYIQSQRELGWKALPKQYDDGGISGGTLQRPALKDLLADIEAGQVDLVVVYKVDRLTRSLMDFSKIIETFDARNVSFVSVTQQFNTANSMGRLTLNMLLSFAQFEREVTAERIRDKIAASKRKGMWMGGLPPLGYDVRDKKLIINPDEAKIVQKLFDLYLEHKSVRKLKAEADRIGFRTKRRIYGDKVTGGQPFTRGHLYCLLHNPIYIGEVAHKGETFMGQHDAIIDQNIWEKAQRLLADQAPNRSAETNVDRRCLLTGLLFDETGDRLCPTYTKRNGRILSYYVSKRLMHGVDPDGAGWRLPASDLESSIVDAVATFFENEDKWIVAVGLSPTSSHGYGQLSDRIREFSRQLRSASQDIVRKVLVDVVDRITVMPGQLIMKLKPDVLNSGGDGHEIVLPFHTKRRGVETKIILGGRQANLEPDQDLIDLIAKARRWFTQITNGEISTVREIAREESMDEGDVSRFLPLAFLAPDIIESILSGKQPIELTPEKLKRLRMLPTSWEEQRTTLGFTA
jgi:site-specific DNA recombinase